MPRRQGSTSKRLYEGWSTGTRTGRNRVSHAQSAVSLLAAGGRSHEAQDLPSPFATATAAGVTPHLWDLQDLLVWDARYQDSSTN